MVYIYIHSYICVCVCRKERERERLSEKLCAWCRGQLKGLFSNQVDIHISRVEWKQMYILDEQSNMYMYTHFSTWLLIFIGL